MLDTFFQVALKSGYNKYLKVEPDESVKGISDAVGTFEQFEPVFQDGKMALMGANNRFISIHSDDDSVHCDQSRYTKMYSLNKNTAS